MCKVPLKLPNPCKNFDPVSDRVLVTVPCNSCPDCRTIRRYDWQTRVYYEYLGTSLNGFTFITTLTFEPDQVPTVDIDGKQFKCFDKPTLQKVLKRFRSRILRNLKLDIQLKYFISSEFGSDHEYLDDRGKLRIAQHMPHYHCLFFVPNCDISLFPALKEQLCYSWPYGMITFSDSNEHYERWSLKGDYAVCHGIYNRDGSRSSLVNPYIGVVDGAGAVGYVCKYVCKDLSEDKELNYMLSQIDKSSPLWKDRLKFLPFHIQSSHLGEYLLEFMEANYPQMLEDGLCVVPDKVDGQRTVKLPLFIERKLFYTQDNPTRSYVLNERGKQLMSRKLLNARENLISDLTSLLNSRRELSTDIINIIKIKLSDKINNTQDFIDYINDKIGVFSLRQLVDYSLLFRDYIYVDDTNGHYDLQYNLFDLLECELDCNEFLQLLNKRLRKERTSHICLIDNNRADYNHARKMIANIKVPDLDAALNALNAYSEAVALYNFRDKITKYNTWLKNRYLYTNKIYDQSTKTLAS